MLTELVSEQGVRIRYIEYTLPAVNLYGILLMEVIAQTIQIDNYFALQIKQSFWKKGA